MVKYFNIKSVAAQEAYKLSMLARGRMIRMPMAWGGGFTYILNSGTQT
ncbi:hypothetical protein LU604_09885 [Erwinia tracheiphila]|nr:hypothetical protein [Erwinia tracheiphila]UIA85125.1 hypothetical protein LU604_09885 [Erwinia tracheiphila]UIA93726.1 hypothetical protein LU632_09850 [Erwinia tracheiphila]